MPTTTATLTPSTHYFTTSQKQLLATLYKFRFVTVGLVARSQGVDRTAIHRRLQKLVTQGYIGQRYDGSYRIDHKEAVYYLLQKGTAYLAQQPFAHPKAIRQIQKDKNASDTFIAHCLKVFTCYLELKQNSPNEYKFFSRTELARYDYYPPYPPDAFITRNLRVSDKPNDYWLDYYEASKDFFVHRLRIRHYIAYAESEQWQKATGINQFPTIVLVCETEQLKRSLQRLIKRELDTTWVELDIIATTTSDNWVG